MVLAIDGGAYMGRLQIAGWVDQGFVANFYIGNISTPLDLRSYESFDLEFRGDGNADFGVVGSVTLTEMSPYNQLTLSISDTNAGELQSRRIRSGVLDLVGVDELGQRQAIAYARWKMRDNASRP